MIIDILENLLENKTFLELDVRPIEILFKKLQKDGNVDIEKAAELEIDYFEKLPFNFGLKSVEQLVEVQPALFVELVQLGHSNDKEGSLSGKLITSINAYGIVTRIKRIPGCNDNEKNEILFNEWIESVCKIATDRQCEKDVERIIGELLSNSPNGEDGIFPHEIVREYIEKNGNDDLLRYILIGKMNSRGVQTMTGGDNQIVIAKEYEKNARKLKIKYPKTAKLLEMLKEAYFSEARYVRTYEENED